VIDIGQIKSDVGMLAADIEEGLWTALDGLDVKVSRHCKALIEDREQLVAIAKAARPHGLDGMHHEGPSEEDYDRLTEALAAWEQH